MTENLLTIEEVAEACGKKWRTVYDWMSERHPNPLPFLKVGGSRRVRPSDLERWISKETDRAKRSRFSA